ncbi:MAG: hypothetical protein KF778_10510 [Rhodocyclaceae bacterium]|nr:hypothetical protein [Rhodocyclaceae bacterium]MBX3668823.1 hypothetical protein [Rhodocyclaceae bacterium]
MPSETPPKAPPLPSFSVDLTQSSVSGLSSGAFMTVQLHLAHSATFVGAGVVAGGPYRCAETFRGAAAITEDAWTLNALYMCMNPLIPQSGPDPAKLVRMARQTARDGLIDPVENLADDKLYIFTGSADSVVESSVVDTTRRFYEMLGVRPDNMLFDDRVPAGHSLITDNPEDNPLDANRPPYLNNGGFFQSQTILNHLYDGLKKPSERLSGRIVRFDQTEFFDSDPRASMSPYAYIYVPESVQKKGKAARIHIALHGCTQGYAFVNFVNGQPDLQNSVPYGNRYFTTTGYNEIADANDMIVLYPQAQGTDDGKVQNPEGCWDWWGYSAKNAEAPDYYSKNAIQINAIYRMLQRLGGQ